MPKDWLPVPHYKQSADGLWLILIFEREIDADRSVLGLTKGLDSSTMTSAQTPVEDSIQWNALTWLGKGEAGL
jgi:hypothetical protein